MCPQTLKTDNPVSGTYIALNGRILHEDEARISPLDRGFLYGDGLFETMKVREGRVDFLEEHLSRLQEAGQMIHIPFPHGFDFQAVIGELIQRNRIQGEASVKICLSRGYHHGDLTLNSPASPTLLILVRPYPSPDPETWEQGLSLSVEKEILQNPTSHLCRLKSLNYLFYLIVRTRAEKKGFQEAILLNTARELCECTTSNLFFFRDDRLETPDLSCGLLPGVLRDALMKCLDEAGQPILEVKRPADALKDCEEIFVTNSLLEIMPVGRIGRKRYPKRKKTLAVRERFQSYRDLLLGRI